MDFNAMPEERCRALLRECLRAGSWVDAVVTGRPYSTLDDLIDAARAAGADLDEPAIDEALAAHPRIGQPALGSSQSARWSRAEQSGVGHAAGIAARLAEGNAAYEDRFGRIFLIRAAGRDGEETLRVLNERLAHSPAQELRVVAGELVDIAVLRLRSAVSA